MVTLRFLIMVMVMRWRKIIVVFNGAMATLRSLAVVMVMMAKVGGGNAMVVQCQELSYFFEGMKVLRIMVEEEVG